MSGQRLSKAELLEAFETGKRPYGEDFANLITECYDRLYAVDNWSIVDTNGVISVNIDGVSIKTNQDGKLEATGLTGPKGDKGDKGDRGFAGEDGRDGNSFIVSKVYNSTEQMNLDFYNGEVKRGQFVVVVKENTEDADHGDVYIKGVTQYEYLNNIKDADGIKGERGEKGEKGDKGDMGSVNIVDNFESSSTTDAASARTAKALYDHLEHHEETNADKNYYGHVKIGDGIDVTSNGIISVPTKDWLVWRRSSNYTMTSTGTVMFNSATGGGISSNNSNGQFTLKAGKTYRITAGGKVGFSGSSEAYCIFTVFSHSSNSAITGSAIYVPLNRNSAEASCGPYDNIITVNSTGNYSLRASSLVGNITMDANAFTLIVQEL